MQNRQNGRRRRGGGGNNNPRPMGQPMGGQSANRLEVRVRGNAHQLLEKYKQLARDAHQAGDRVAAEYYLQHSDHYFRVLNDSRIRQEEMRARRGVFDQFDEDSMGGDGDDASDGGEDGGDSGGEAVRREKPERTERTERAPRPERAERTDDQERSRRWQERRPEKSRIARDTPDGEDAPSSAPLEVVELRMSDGEAALVAFGGAPAREAADEADAEAPKPRRRGRPRKTVEPAES